MHEYDGALHLPMTPPSLFEQLKDFEMGEGDVLFSTYPKSGTPFLSDMLYLIHHHADVDKVKTVPHGILLPFLDHVIPNYDPVIELGKAPKPRLLKVQLPSNPFERQIREGKMKALMMSRNPKDNLVLYYKFYKMTPGPIRYQGSWSDFFELFKAKQLFVGDWFDFFHSWWSLRHLPNVKVMAYEEVRKDPKHWVRHVAEFCNQTLTSDEEEKIAKYLEQEAPEDMTPGGWKEYFTDEQSRYFDELYINKMASAADFSFGDQFKEDMLRLCVEHRF